MRAHLAKLFWDGLALLSIGCVAFLQQHIHWLTGKKMFNRK